MKTDAQKGAAVLERIALEAVAALARRAGDAVMAIRAKGFGVTYKADSSPLTEADLEANRIICDGLQAAYPGIPLLSEENASVAYSARKGWEYYWCIDPIDGTEEFIKNSGEFTVNIALIHKDTPVLGVVYAPALGEMYTAKRGEGAFKNGERLPRSRHAAPERVLRVVASKSHLSQETERYIDALAETAEAVRKVFRGSSLKLCMVAEGEADLYPRMGPTMEWDTAAADAIVREAGKMTYRYDPDVGALTPLVYNKADLLNPWFVVR